MNEEDARALLQRWKTRANGLHITADSQNLVVEGKLRAQAEAIGQCIKQMEELLCKN